MKRIFILISIAFSVIAVSFLSPEPSFNGSNPGCSGSGCHTFQNGIVSVTSLGNLQVEVTVSGTSSKVGGELVDEFGNVVSVINSTTSNPFILTAPSDGAYLVNAGFKNPSRRWDSSAVDISTLVPPAAPSTLIAILINNPLSVELNWTDNSDNEDGFIIERNTITDVFAVLDTVPQNVTTYLDTNVDVLTYDYRVKAFNGAGESAYSDTAQVVVPVELSLFTVSFVNNGVSIDWTTATETNNLGFEVQRKLSTNWETISFIGGGGTTTEQRTYSFFDDLENVFTNVMIKYRLKQIDYDGTFSYSDTKEIEVDLTPDKFSLNQNYPNPFNPSTTIVYTIPDEGIIQLNVYNLIGEKVDNLINELQQPGIHTATWDASLFSSGIYYYRMDFQSLDFKSSKSIVKKMILLK